MLDIFVPTYPPDLEQFSVLIRSLDTYLDLDAVATLNIALVGPNEDIARVQKIDTLKFRARTRYFLPSDLGMCEPDGSRTQGWNLQQVAKLSFARHATSAFYMVMDSKNLALRPVRLDDLVRNGKAAITLEDAEIHKTWWRGAAWALAYRRFDRKPGRQALSAATPVILHSESVTAMVNWLERKHRMSLPSFFLKRRRIRSRFMQVTEFSMYYVFMDRENLLDRYHFESDGLHDVPSQIWSDQTPDDRSARLARILGCSTTGLFTGIQPGAWQALTPEEKAAIAMLAAGALPRA